MQLRKEPDKLSVSFLGLIADQHVYSVTAPAVVIGNNFTVQRVEIRYIFQKSFKTIR